MVAIDGKTSRFSAKIDVTPLHLVSTFAAGSGLVFWQRATAQKSNKKTAIPELLAALALDGCIVTLDAMGMRRIWTRKQMEYEAESISSATRDSPHRVFAIAENGTKTPVPAVRLLIEMAGGLALEIFLDSPSGEPSELGLQAGEGDASATSGYIDLLVLRPGAANFLRVGVERKALSRLLPAPEES